MEPDKTLNALIYGCFKLLTKSDIKAKTATEALFSILNAMGYEIKKVNPPQPEKTDEDAA